MYYILKCKKCNYTNLKLLDLFLVDNNVISSIGKGLCVLVGICRDDTPKDIEYMYV